MDPAGGETKIIDKSLRIGPDRKAIWMARKARTPGGRQFFESKKRPQKEHLHHVFQGKVGDSGGAGGKKIIKQAGRESKSG